MMVGGVAPVGASRGQAEFNALFQNMDYNKDDFVSVQPRDMAIELLPFQKEGVGWMLRRELAGQGGIMADHLGMGKTVQMIGLCLEADRIEKAHRRATGADARHREPQTKEGVDEDTRLEKEREQLQRKSKSEQAALGHRVITVARQLQKVPAVGNCSKITQPGKDLLRIITETEARLEDGDTDFSQGINDLQPWLKFCHRYYPSFERRASAFLKESEAVVFDDVDTPELRTLVVVPASLVYQWGSELENKVKADRRLHIYRLHSAESRDITAAQLESMDFVITTYDIVTRMAGQSVSAKHRNQLEWDMKKAHPLFQVRWKRLILDEAHVIRNPNTSRTTAIDKIHAVKKWAVTATPFHNSIADIQTLMKVAGTPGLPLPNTSNHAQVTAALLRDRTLQRSVARALMPVLLRRSPVMKRHGKMVTLVKLPQKHEEIVRVELYPHEGALYNTTLAQAKAGVSAATKNATINALAMMVLLRQTCLHPWLGEGKAVASYLCNICQGQAVDPVLSRCGHAFCYDCLRNRFSELSEAENTAVRVPCPTCGTAVPLSVFKKTHASSHFLRGIRQKPWTSSSKVDHTLSVVRSVLSDFGRDKIVIFSQFTRFLDVLTLGLEQYSIPSLRIDGSMPIASRNAIIQRYASENTRVLLASKMAVGVGLNLTTANHVILTDPWWNPAIEEQAVHRCHRIGQKKDVFITRLVASDTIEDYCFNVAQKKKEFGDAILAVAMDQADDFDLGGFSLDTIKRLEPVKVVSMGTQIDAKQSVTGRGA